MSRLDATAREGLVFMFESGSLVGVNGWDGLQEMLQDTPSSSGWFEVQD